MRNGCQVHNLLNRTRAEHSKTCLTTSHNILMITKDTQRVRSQCTSRNIEHTWQQFTCDFIHIRDHKEQTLRCCECSGESTSLQRTVNGTSSTTLRLQNQNKNVLSPEVLATTGSPFVNMLRHWR